MAAGFGALVLRDKPGLNLERVRAAMQGGEDNFQVNLTKPIPVLILYGTAVVDEEGRVHFFDDLYGHDAALEKVRSEERRVGKECRSGWAPESERENYGDTAAQ